MWHVAILKTTKMLHKKTSYYDNKKISKFNDAFI